MPSVSDWIKSYPDLEDLHPGTFDICGRFMKNGKYWILPENLRRLQKMCPAIWNLRIPKKEELLLNQFGTCKFQITRSFRWMHFCISVSLTIG